MRYIKDLILLIVVLSSFLISQKYQVYGLILDFDTQIPINNANIFITDFNNGTMTNQDGYFEILIDDMNLKSQMLLNVEIIGYEKKIILIDFSKKKIDLGKIFLKNNPIELKTLEIYSEENQSKQISDIILSGSKLNQNLKGNIASTLSNHPNIGINSFGSVTSKPALRGLSGDRFLLTKEGIETGDLSQSSIDHAIVLDMTEVSQIEIIRGPKSLVYGPNAIGGVINTNLFGNPKNRFNKFHHRYLIGKESFNNGIYGNIMLYVPIKNNQINVFASNRTTENETSSIGELDNTKSNTAHYKLGFTRYYKNFYINFIAERFNMDYGIPPTSNGHIDGVDIFLLKDSYQINYHQDLSIGNFKNLDIKYNFHDYVHSEIVNQDSVVYNIFDLIEEGSSHVLLAKETQSGKLELSSNNSIFGFEYNNKKFKPEGFYLTPETEETQISIYGFNQTKINDLDIDILSSFRFGNFFIKPNEYNVNNGNANLYLKDKDGNAIYSHCGLDNLCPGDDGYFRPDSLESRISLVRDRKFNNISFSFGLKKKFDKFELNSWIMQTMRPPRVEELYSDGPHLASYAFEIGNPNLKAEKIYGIENSLRYNSNLFKFSLVTFYNQSPYYFEMTKDGHCEVPDDWKPWTTHPCYGVDWIDWGSGRLGWLHEYSAKGSQVIIKGLELDLKYKLRKIKFNYNFSFVKGDSQSLNIPLSYMNPTKQILNLDYINQYINYKIRFSKINSVEEDRLGEFETLTPGAFLTDIIISYNYKMHSLTIQFNNVFDKVYYNHLSRIKNITPDPGKNFHLIYKIIL